MQRLSAAQFAWAQLGGFDPTVLTSCSSISEADATGAVASTDRAADGQNQPAVEADNVDEMPAFVTKKIPEAAKEPEEGEAQGAKGWAKE